MSPPSGRLAAERTVCPVGPCAARCGGVGASRVRGDGDGLRGCVVSRMRGVFEITQGVAIEVSAINSDRPN